MPPLYLAVQAGLLAVLFGLVVLLPLFEQTMRGVVVSWVFLGLESVFGVFRRGAVAGFELFEKFAASFRSVLPLRMILGAFLYAVTVLHQSCFLLVPVSLYDLRKLGARL